MIDWRDTRVSADGTHHTMGGVPLYAPRFDAVLKFHAPGLAPVRSGGEAWHVDLSGAPAYAARFRQTFGYYEGCAAVEESAGWCHVDTVGRPLYAERYAWVGNRVEGRAPARQADGRYLHLDERGRPVSADRWRYVGDFRDGIAVVQGEHGRSTHVDRQGRPSHGAWFLDLDVFHKGLARARDEGGWTHVDARGKARYERRFAAVEPFYNGQARVERADGGLEVIDERGRTLVELRGPTRPPLHALSAELVSFWRCEALYAAVELGVFDALPLADGALTDPRRRLLAALGELGLVERQDGRWTSTVAGSLLREGPASMAPVARYWAGRGRAPWRRLGPLLRGEVEIADPFAAMAADPREVREFHAAMQIYALEDYAGLPGALDQDHRHLLDAGGGTGTLASLVLRARPALSATVLDRPEVVAIARPPADLADRLRYRAFDLFEPWPTRGDAIVLARVLHDWDDEAAARLLRRAAGALEPGGRVYVVELARPEGSLSGSLLDLHMLLATGGRERTPSEHEVLLTRAGLRVVEVRPLPGINQVIVADRA